jgi:biotin carboxyl carrier protein
MPDTKTVFEVKANEFEFCFTSQEVESANLVHTAPLVFNLLQNNRSVNAKILMADLASKKFTVEVEGENFMVEIKDELDQVLQKMGFGLAANKIIKEIKAPMPGRVIEIAVCNGQAVNEGDKILILEAMKMENCIVIHSAATIKNVAVVAGQTVEKGQLLIELE